MFQNDVERYFDQLAVMGVNLSADMSALVDQQLAERKMAFDRLNDSPEVLNALEEEMIEPLCRSLRLCTVVWLVLMARYARKGFLASIVQLSGNLISLLGARQLSAACAGWVFENLLAGGFRTQIAAHLSEDGVVNLSGIAQQYAGFLPESFRASIVAACERSINAVLADNAVVLADTIVEKVLQPLLTPVIMLVLFFVFYAVLRLLVSMLVTVLGLVNKLPVIGTAIRN